MDILFLLLSYLMLSAIYIFIVFFGGMLYLTIKYKRFFNIKFKTAWKFTWRKFFRKG